MRKPVFKVKDYEFDLDKWQNGGNDVSFKDSCFYPYWNNLPRLVEDAPLGEVPAIDPYLFSHRMALGKYIIQHTGENWAGGKTHEMGRHWYWGYIAQLDWQWRSGRFQMLPNKDISDVDEDVISRESWWGFMNMNFIVALYFGAADAGIVPKLKLVEEAADVYTNRSFQKCVEHWKIFWQETHAQFLEDLKLKAFEDAEKSMYQKLWQTHSSIIESSIPVAKESGLEDLMPVFDRKAGLGWCRLVLLLEAMSWTHLSLDSILTYGIGFLPTIRLSDEECIEFLRANRNKEYVTVLSLWEMSKLPDSTLCSMQAFFRRIARLDSERKNFPLILDTLTYGSSLQKLIGATRLLFVASFPQSTTEYSIYFSMLVVIIALYSFRTVV